MSVKKRDDDSDCRFQDKSQLFMETKAFSLAQPLPRKSRLLIGKCLMYLYTDSELNHDDINKLFVSITKLYQSKDSSLRHIIYLPLKELGDKAKDSILAISSLSRDISNTRQDGFSSGPFTNSSTSSSVGSGFLNAAASFGFRIASAASSSSSSSNSSSSPHGSGNTIVGSSISHRASAIRAFCKLASPDIMATCERVIKQAIIDKSASVSGAALACSCIFAIRAPEIVRHWANEAQEAFSSNKAIHSGMFSSMVQYHALCFLYLIRRGDRMAVAKLVQSSTKPGAVRSAWAQCMLIRFAVRCCHEEMASSGGRNMTAVPGSLSASMYEYIKQQCNSNDLVMLEAARGICSLVTGDHNSSLTATQAQPAVQTLQSFLTSSKQALKFGALRTLNQLAQVSPSLVASCNLDMEALISDPNRSVATYAITTLLKTGTEVGVDRLMKQIGSFMNEISDEFKIIVVDAIRVLAVKFPAKQASLLNFLSSVLREEGGYEYKKSVVEAIFALVKSLPDCLETALPHFCEFIEDCEFTKLAVRILHLLGTEAPKAKDPTRLIRYIYNRVILENSNVRAAAVSALASIGAQIPSVRRNIITILGRCVEDPDDEVRDRAVYYLQILGTEELHQPFILTTTVASLAALQAKIANYQSVGDFSVPFDASTVPQVSQTEQFNNFRGHSSMLLGATNATRGLMPISSGISGYRDSDHHQVSHMHQSSGIAGPVSAATAGVGSTAHTANPLASFEGVSKLTPLVPTHYKSSLPFELTEKEMEFLVTCIKHIFRDHIVFEFRCTNTIDSVVLLNAQMRMTSVDNHGKNGNEMKIVDVIPASVLAYGECTSTFVVFALAQGTFPQQSFRNSLVFRQIDCDASKPGTATAAATAAALDPNMGINDHYAVEDVHLEVRDYITPSAVADFSAIWESLGQTKEVLEIYELSFGSVAEAASSLVQLLGLMPLENTEQVSLGKMSHTLLLSGLFAGTKQVLSRIRMAMEPSSGVTTEIAVRSDTLDISEIVLIAVQ